MKRKLPRENSFAIAGDEIYFVDACNIVASSARDVVGFSVLCLDKIGAASTDQEIPSRTTVDFVIAQAARERVRAVRAVQGLVAFVGNGHRSRSIGG